jgi:hypothetical protein
MQSYKEYFVVSYYEDEPYDAKKGSVMPRLVGMQIVHTILEADELVKVACAIGKKISMRPVKIED